MTPQELKNSILQLAIQGKLVEQRPEEGTAEELYKQIQAEKQALIKAGKIKKEKPLPEITEDEIPFDIPESWKWVRLAELCTIVTGKRDANFGSPNGRYFFFTCAKDPIRCNSYSFSGESLLLAGNGDIGNISYYWGQFEAYQRTYVVQPYIEGSYLVYLFYHLQSNWVQYNTGMVYGTAIPYIRLGNVQNYMVAFPPLAEQKRIVARIEELLPLIDRYEKAWTRLEDFNKRFPVDMQKSILQLAIQGKLVEQRPEEGTGEELYQQIQKEKQALIKAGKIKKEKLLPEITEDEIPFEIPESWKWVRLGMIIQFIGGFAYKSPTYVQHSKNQVIRLGNVKTNQLLLDVKQVFIPDRIAADTEDYRIKVDDILVTMTGTRKKRDYFYTLSVTETDLSDHYLFLNQRVGCLRTFDGVFTPYLLSVLQNEVIKDLIFAKETGTANQGNIGSEDMKKYILIPLPPHAEQKRIVARLEELLPLCERLK